MKKSQIILANDSHHKDEFLKWVHFCHQNQIWLKIGMESFYTFGSQIFDDIPAETHIFLDLKLHDIPNTVENALRALCRLPIKMINVHALGGLSMLKSATKIKNEFPEIKFIAVTHLTSLSENDFQDFQFQADLQTSACNLAKLSHLAGLDGVVCSGHEIKIIKESTSQNFLTIVPGIRLDKNQDDQKRVMTPNMAQKNGADYLVIGRPITQAAHPQLVIQEIKESLV
jgi:orotidine-5'-phosphate decarboxylase